MNEACTVSIVQTARFASVMKSPTTDRDEEGTLSFDDLPDEVLEFILSFVPPYKDLHDCMLVCKRWRSSVLNVVQMKRRNLMKALRNFDIRWQSLSSSAEKMPTIAMRYSHAAVVHADSMYVFGGCTNSMTTFNDLWKLDLSRRQWVRLVSTGAYPTPKACSTMVSYKHLLVLFGGWAYPSQYPFHQSYQLFNELHLFDTDSNRWNVVTTNAPPPMAGHSVSVHGRWMVVFGGMHSSSTTGNSVQTNDLWKLNLEDFVWQKQETTGPKPTERYGHSHTVLDHQNVLIMGGCGGPNGRYNDVWLLNMCGSLWTWREITVHNRQWAPPDTWCHPTCRVNDCIVLLNRSRSGERTRASHHHPRPPERRPHVSPDVPNQVAPHHTHHHHQQQRHQPNAAARAADGSRPSTSRSVASVGGDVTTPRRHVHPPQINPSMGRMTLSMLAFADPKPNRSVVSSANRERQLDMLRKMENRINNRNRTGGREAGKRAVVAAPAPAPAPSPVTWPLSLYVLDISTALGAQPLVSWLKPAEQKTTAAVRRSAPEETLLYSLVHGKSELIMFGGIQKDSGSVNVPSADFDPESGYTKVSNSLHFISAPADII